MPALLRGRCHDCKLAREEGLWGPSIIYMRADEGECRAPVYGDTPVRPTCLLGLPHAIVMHIFLGQFSTGAHDAGLIETEIGHEFGPFAVFDEAIGNAETT